MSKCLGWSSFVGPGTSMMSLMCEQTYEQKHSVLHTPPRAMLQCNLHLYLNKGMFEIIMLMQSHCLPNHFPLASYILLLPPPISMWTTWLCICSPQVLHPAIISSYLFLSPCCPLIRERPHIVAQEELRRSQLYWNAFSRCFTIWALLIAFAFFLWGLEGREKRRAEMDGGKEVFSIRRPTAGCFSLPGCINLFGALAAMLLQEASQHLELK